MAVTIPKLIQLTILEWLSLTAVICFIQFIGLINRGDSFRRKPSKASSLPHSKKSGDQNEPKLLKEIVSYTIGMLGGPGVGKTALISQFMTSECINAYDRQRGNHFY